MRRSRLRSRLAAVISVAAVVTAGGVLFVPAQAEAPVPPGAVISSGNVVLGVNALGDLNYQCDVDRESCPGPSAGEGTSTVGLRDADNNLEATADGEGDEGWGVGDATTGFSGYANVAVGDQNVTATAFTATADRAVSTVDVQGGRTGQSLQVVQDYHPSPATPDLYANTVTITNTGQQAIGDLRYRRTVDWDIEPSAFSEWVTAGGTSPELQFNSDDGFASSDPLAGPGYKNSQLVCDEGYTGPCQYEDLGQNGTHADNPDATSTDSGALYDFAFGTVEAGQSVTLTVFYGAAPSEKDALAALSAAGAQVYSLGESSCANDSVSDCGSTNPGGGGGDFVGGGGDRVGPAAARAAAADPPVVDDPPLAGVDLGEPATFMLGFATGSADLAVSQSDVPDPVIVGSQVTYDVAVTNQTGNPATGVHLADTLPAGTTFVSATPDQGTCTDAGADLTCELGTIGDATVHVQVVVTTGATGTITNTATVSSATRDPDPTDNTSSEPTTVNPVPPPVAVDDAYSTTEDTALTVSAANGVLSNDTNPSGVGTLTVAPGTTAPGHGTVTLNPNGSLTYQPAANYDGADSFTYRVTNGSQTSAAATVRITVDAANDPPVAVGNAYSTPEDTTLAVAAPGVLGNDSDPDDDPLTAVLATGPSHGTLTLGTDGRLTYVPVANYHGPDSFTYRASDGQATSGPATVTLTVTSVDDPIVAQDDSYTTPRDTTLTMAAPGVLGNDTDVDGRASASALSQPEHGTLTLDEDGSFVYTPTTNYVGDDSFRYTAGDNSTATVTITVSRGPNRAPTAMDDGYVSYEDTPFAVTNPAEGVLHNDTDPDGDTLTATLVQGTANGDVTLNSDGTFTYTPEPNFHGDDSFTYYASDGTASSDAVTVTITVTPVQDPPVANNDDDYTTPEDTTLTVAAPGVLGNDSDVDGDSIIAEQASDTTHGTVTLDPDGALRYVPDPGFVGTDTFTYRARSGEETSDLATVTITVTPVNHRPVAAADTYSTSRNTRLTVAVPGVLGNDSDPDAGQAISAVRTSGPSHGTLTLDADGRFEYTPASGFSGTDTFRYRASDGLLSSPSATVTITVTAPVPPPPPSTTPPSTPPVSTPPSAPPVTTPPVGPPNPDVPVPPVDTPATPQPTVDEPTETPTTPPTAPPSSGSDSQSLRLTALSVNPGGDLRAKGSGCAPNSAIQLTVAGRPVGSGSADAGGGFDIPVTTTGLIIGTHTVTATCGEKQLLADVALVSTTSNTNAPTAQALVVAAALAFFLLLLGLVLRRPTS